jgi:hypothetical protein
MQRISPVITQSNFDLTHNLAPYTTLPWELQAGCRQQGDEDACNQGLGNHLDSYI